MNHIKVLDEARATVAERAAEYGGVSDCFTRIAQIAALILNKEVTAHDVAMIHIATKLGRLAYNPRHGDSYTDLVNYAAFAREFSLPPEEERAIMPRVAPLAAKSGETRSRMLQELEKQIANPSPAQPPTAAE